MRSREDVVRSPSSASRALTQSMQVAAARKGGRAAAAAAAAATAFPTGMAYAREAAAARVPHPPNAPQQVLASPQSHSGCCPMRSGNQ